MNKPHKIYTEEEVKSYFKKGTIIKYTVINPLNDSEEDHYHDCDIASISIYEKVVGSRYESDYGMLDYYFTLASIVNIENISYDEFKRQVTPTNI